MRVERLRFTDFRNYRELDLALPGGLVVLQGRNAQGKSNILEAIGLIATSRSFRTSSEREAVRWGAPGRFARIEATVARDHDPLTVEIVVADPQATIPGETPSATPAPMPPGAPFRKRIRVNGVARRAMDLLGQVTVVVFAPDRPRSGYRLALRAPPLPRPDALPGASHLLPRAQPVSEGDRPARRLAAPCARERGRSRTRWPTGTSSCPGSPRRSCARARRSSSRRRSRRRASMPR